MFKKHKKKFIAAFILIGLLEYFFIGVPVYYKHQTYQITQHPNIISDIEFVFRIYESVNDRFAGAIPIKSGNPYKVTIDAYGIEGKHISVTFHSISITDDFMSYEVVEQSKPIKSEFIAHSIWLTHIYPKSEIELPFEPGKDIKLHMIFDIQYRDRIESFNITRTFKAKEVSGWGILAFKHAIMYI